MRGMVSSLQATGIYSSQNKDRYCRNRSHYWRITSENVRDNRPAQNLGGVDEIDTQISHKTLENRGNHLGAYPIHPQKLCAGLRDKMETEGAANAAHLKLDTLKWK